jgi:hypothetical protein
MAFAKCVTSPNDFAVDNFQGVPDEYDGRVLAKRHMFVGACPVSNSTTDTYIFLLPIPGIAYWTGTRTAGSVAAFNLTPVAYSDNATLFPASSESTIVTEFRYASNVVEIVPTVNQMAWGGSIEVFKFPIGEGKSVNASDLYTILLQGLDVANSTRPDSVLPFNHGVYSVTSCLSNACDFVPIVTNSPYSIVTAPVTATANINFTSASINYVGLGKQEGVMIKIPATAASNTGLIRTWACVEYNVSSNSVLYEYSHISPPCDLMALSLVKKFIKEQPAGVPFYDNESFWRTFLTWVRNISGPLRVLPGPVGEVARITNLISETVLPYTS